jgi:23S rRNA pseudouridine955/2504/2580 synthase
MKALTIEEAQAGQRLDRYLAKYLNKAPKSFLYKMMRKKNIVLNGKKCDGSEKIQTGDEIQLFLSQETIDGFRETAVAAVPKQNTNIRLDILYEDADILIINKPVGVLSQKAAPTDISMNEYIRSYVADGRKSLDETVFKPSVCNRLDRNTSGIITAGKTVRGAQILSESFQEHDSVEKYYLCVAAGVMKKRLKTDAYLLKDKKNNKVSVSRIKTEDAEHIVTEYIPVSDNGTHTFLKVRLYTGKPHQIRAHLAYLGHPLAGDSKYGDLKECAYFKKKYGIQSQLLHSFELNLKKLPLHVYAPVPEYMKRFLDGEQLWVHGTQEDLEDLH